MSFIYAIIALLVPFVAKSGTLNQIVCCLQFTPFYRLFLILENQRESQRSQRRGKLRGGGMVVEEEKEGGVGVAGEVSALYEFNVC